MNRGGGTNRAGHAAANAQNGAVDATPIRALLATWESDVEVLLRHLSREDAVPKTWRKAIDQLRHALADAEHVDVWVTVEHAATLSGRGASTIRRLCNTQPETIGARKFSGAWRVHLPTFRTFLNPTTLQEKAA